MIINFPTGFYITILPQEPEQSGNVTFTISDNIPPRSNSVFSQIPEGIRRRQHVGFVYTEQERRAAVAQLAYSVSSGLGDTVSSGVKQFESGQILEFDDTQITDIEPMLVVNTTETRHDTNLLDLASLGMTDSDISTLDQQAAETHAILIVELNDLKTARANVEIQIALAQRQLNETNKALDGVDAILSVTPDAPISDIKQLLTDKSASLSEQIVGLVEQANEFANSAAQINDDLNRVSQLVR